MIIIDDLSLNYHERKILLTNTNNCSKEIFLFCDTEQEKLYSDLTIKKVYLCNNEQAVQNKIFGFIHNIKNNNKVNLDDIDNIILYTNDLIIKDGVFSKFSKTNEYTDLEIVRMPTVTYSLKKKNLLNSIIYYDIENVSSVKILENFLDLYDIKYNVKKGKHLNRNEEDDIIEEIEEELIGVPLSFKDNAKSISEINVAAQNLQNFEKQVFILDKYFPGLITQYEVPKGPNSADIKLLNCLLDNIQNNNTRNKKHILFSNDNEFITNFSSLCINNDIDFSLFFKKEKVPASIKNNDLADVAIGI